MSDYIPQPDLEGINSADSKNPIKDLTILLLGFVAILATFFWVAVSISDWALTQISLESEMKYVGKIWSVKAFEKKYPEDFLSLIDKINSDLPIKVQVGITCSEQPNAFALPGGLIYLTSGLLEKLKSENALAFVIGHEIGHILNRDHIRGFGRQIIFALTTELLGFGDRFGIARFSDVIARSYDRNQESSADIFSLGQMQKIYGHTWGTEELFKILAAEETVLTKSMSLSSTHPLSSQRLNKITQMQMGSAKPLVMPTRPFSTWSKEMGCKKDK